MSTNYEGLTNFEFLMDRMKAGELVGFEHENGDSCEGFVVDVELFAFDGNFSVTFYDPKTTTEFKKWFKIDLMRVAP